MPIPKDELDRAIREARKKAKEPTKENLEEWADDKDHEADSLRDEAANAEYKASEYRGRIDNGDFVTEEERGEWKEVLRKYEQHRKDTYETEEVPA